MGILISRGVHQVSRIENIIVSVKLLVILMFIVVGMTAIHPQNYSPFIPLMSLEQHLVAGRGSLPEQHKFLLLTLALMQLRLIRLKQLIPKRQCRED